MSRRPWQVSVMHKNNLHEHASLRCSGKEIGLALEALLIDCPTWPLREDLYGPGDIGIVPRSEFPLVDHAMGPTLEAECRSYKLENSFEDEPSYQGGIDWGIATSPDELLAKWREWRATHPADINTYRPTLMTWSNSRMPQSPLHPINHDDWDLETIRKSTNSLLNRLVRSDKYKKALSEILRMTEGHALGNDPDAPRSDPHLLLREIRLLAEAALAEEQTHVDGTTIHPKEDK